MQTLKEFLFASGILEYGTPEEIEEAKRAYRKEYLREKKRAFRAENQEVTIAFPKKDIVIFEENAIYHNMRLADYVKACVYAYVNQGFIIPDNQQIQKLELLLRRIGNNVNQIARSANTFEEVEKENIQLMQNQINNLEAELSQQLRQPLNLEIAIRNELKRNPFFIHRLLYLVKTLQTDVYQNAAT